MLNIKKTDGIVIRKNPFGNTSEIITFYTKDYGKITAIAKGLHRKKSPFEGYLEQLSLNEIVFIDGEGRHLSTLTESSQKSNFSGLRKNVRRIEEACFLAEFIEAMVAEYDPDIELFNLFLESLIDLSKNDDILCTVSFAAKALKALGLMPEVIRCSGCEKAFSRDEEAWISLSGEGVLCRRCCHEDAGDFKISASSRAIFDKILHWQGRGVRRIRPSAANFKEMWRFLKVIVRSVLKKDLRTFKYVGEN